MKPGVWVRMDKHNVVQCHAGFISGLLICEHTTDYCCVYSREKQVQVKYRVNVHSWDCESGWWRCSRYSYAFYAIRVWSERPAEITCAVSCVAVKIQFLLSVWDAHHTRDYSTCWHQSLSLLPNVSRSALQVIQSRSVQVLFGRKDPARPAVWLEK